MNAPTSDRTCLLEVNGLVPGGGLCCARDCGASANPGNLTCRSCWSKAPAAARRALYAVLHAYHAGNATLATLRTAQRVFLGTVEGCDTCPELGSEGLDECPSSKRTCGHHCNCGWTASVCDWCGATGDPDTGEFPAPDQAGSS